MTDVEGPDPGTDTARARRHRLVVRVLCVGGLVSALSQTLVLPIQGELPRLLGAEPADTASVVTITLLVGAVTMPAVGRASDLWGRRSVLVATALALLVGSVVIATAGSLPQVLVGRGLQGVAMGYIPVGISVIKAVTPPELTTRAISSLSATLGVGGALGLPLAAWVVQVSTWNVVFWFSAAAGLVMLVLTALVVPEAGEPRPARPFDLPGAIGLAVGLSAVLIAISKGNDWGWSAPSTLLCLTCGLGALVAWAVYELTRADPLVDIRLMAQPRVLGVNLAAVFIGFGMMGSAVLIPQLLQLPEEIGHGMGQSLVATGLWMAPGGMAMMLVAPVASRLITRKGARLALTTGALTMAAGYLVAVALMTQPWHLFLATVISSAGVGIAYAALPVLVLAVASPAQAGTAVAVNTLMRSVGTTVAGATMAALLLRNTTWAADGLAVPTQGAFHVAFVVGAISALIGALVAVVTPDGTRRPGSLHMTRLSEEDAPAG